MYCGGGGEAPRKRPRRPILDRITDFDYEEKTMACIGKLRKYNDNYFRVTEMKSHPEETEVNNQNIVNNSGLAEKIENENPKKIVVRGVNTEKLPESLSRTKSLVFEIMICNAWDYFATFTLGNKYERNNIDVFRKTFMVWLKNYNARYNLSIKYLLIPEQHKDGKNWHLHGAIMGLPIEHLTPFLITGKLPIKMLNKIAMGSKLYNWTAYAEKFGYVSLEGIHSHKAISKYITKYISKDIKKTPIEFNRRMFWASHGLKRAEVLHEGEILQNFKPDFENDYIKTKAFENMEEALQLFAENHGDNNEK